jgi:hypothetical protein
MRYLVALTIAAALIFAAFWVGARISILVTQPHREHNDFTVGRKMDLCGYQVDMRHEMAGYDLKKWRGSRCDNLSSLDHCVLECLSQAGTVEIAKACYPDCVGP